MNRQAVERAAREVFFQPTPPAAAASAGQAGIPTPAATVALPSIAIDALLVSPTVGDEARARR